MGAKFELRDPNWNTNTGYQAVRVDLEKPAVMVIHNPDVQTCCCSGPKRRASTSSRSIRGSAYRARASSVS